MEADFTCNSPTLPAQDALKERFKRIDAKMALLRELEAYAESIRAARMPKVDDIAHLVGFEVELPEVEYEYEPIEA